LNYSSKFFTGKAVKIGAGVQGAELFAAANAQNVVVVGGDCPSIGLAGGYTQGGGHSILSSLYGLGADQVLEWEVLTAQGQHLIATPRQNQDLYWALSGGGGGTYGVVISLTIRTHPTDIVGGAVLGFAVAGIPNDTYWDAIAYWQILQEELVDAGTTTLTVIVPSGF
jgi:FAD/FMN-containing dehydrogenase